MVSAATPQLSGGHWYVCHTCTHHPRPQRVREARVALLWASSWRPGQLGTPLLDEYIYNLILVGPEVVLQTFTVFSCSVSCLYLLIR